jgi:hypothetical protein
MTQYYVLCYKGKTLGPPMVRDEAEAKLIIMQRCFYGLELVPFQEEGISSSVLDPELDKTS